CSGGTCGGTAVVCTALDECHQAGTCAPATGMCSNPASPMGTPCTGGACDGAGNCEATTTTTTTSTSSTTSTTTTSTTQAPTTTLPGTTTGVVSSINPSVSGQPVTFTATVKAKTSGAGTPTGTVTFRDGPTTLGTGTLNASGHATFVTSTLAVGAHPITASY